MLTGQVVISPRNYFLFTPLLPSVTVGTLAARSVIEPTRFLTRHLPRKVEVYEGEVTAVDVDRKVLKFIDNSEINKDGSGVDAVKVDGRELKYDYLVYAVGAENQTFGIQGVKENACFLKELGDAEKIRSRLMDCAWIRCRLRARSDVCQASRPRPLRARARLRLSDCCRLSSSVVDLPESSTLESSSASFTLL